MAKSRNNIHYLKALPPTEPAKSPDEDLVQSLHKRIDKIHVQSVARLFADAIHAIHDGSSVSRLFR